jgi:hypothetical protein
MTKSLEASPALKKTGGRGVERDMLSFRNAWNHKTGAWKL